MRKKWFLSLTLIFLTGTIVYLPLGEFFSYLEFRWIPTYAKQSHFFRLKGPKSELIYLLGTVHERHFHADGGYPYSEIKSALTAIEPDLLLVEIRPDSINQGFWGEGPPEMPYAVAIANELKIPVRGIDFWRRDYSPMRDFDERENKMSELIVGALGESNTTLILTGYSHISGLRHRLLAQQGFSVDNSFGSSEKLAIFSRAESELIPQNFFDAVSKAIERVSEHRSDYSEEWANGRRLLSRSLEAKAER